MFKTELLKITTMKTLIITAFIVVSIGLGSYYGGNYLFYGSDTEKYRLTETLIGLSMILLGCLGLLITSGIYAGVQAALKGIEESEK